MSYLRHCDRKHSDIEWLEDIPLHWEQKRLRFIADISNSNVDKKEYEEQTPVQLCNYTDVYYNEIITPELDFMEATASATEIKKFGLQAGDVIITKDSEDPKDIGIPAFVQTDMPGVVCGYHLSIIRCGDPVTAEFIQFSIMSHLNKARLYVDTPGVTRFGLGQDTIKNILVLLPPPEERLEIVRRLRSETAEIDGLIEKKTRFIALLKEKRTADIIEAISPKEGWSRFPFWSVAKPKSISGRPDEGLLSVYLDRGVIPYSEGGGLVHKPAESLEKYQMVEPGDLVMNNQQAWRGSLGVSLHRGIVSPAYLVLKLDREKIDPTFANYIFRARPYVEKFMLSSMSVGDIQRQIKWPHLRIVPVVVPSVEEQRKIAERLDNEGKRIDDLIALTERSIDLLREKRAALITAAVTGKIDVRTAA